MSLAARPFAADKSRRAIGADGVSGPLFGGHGVVPSASSVPIRAAVRRMVPVCRRSLRGGEIVQTSGVTGDPGTRRCAISVFRARSALSLREHLG
jgi:hypothetical protein